MSIRLRVTLVIIFSTLIIILFSISSGIIYVRKNIEKSHETSLMMTANIADHFISSEIEQLKLKHMVIAHSLAASGEADWPEILAGQKALYPEFIGMAVLDAASGPVAMAGELPARPEVMDDPNIKRAFQGKAAISSTVPSTRGVVFYLAAPIPGAPGRILTITLPGTYFSQLVSAFVVWETGHLFIDDKEGYVIANIRDAWVQNRHNFIRLAETDEQYESAARLIQRGTAGETGVGNFSISGVRRICAFKPIRGSEEGWFLGVVAPLPESPFRDIHTGLVVVGFVSFFLSFIAAIIAASFIRKPFEETAALKELAEANSRAKSAFLAHMSHEIRTPINSIIGFSELALGDEISDKTRDYLNKIMLDSEWLLQIINDVLDIAKIESGKMELEKVPFDLRELFAACRTIITPKADEKRVLLYFYAEPLIGQKLVGDPVRLRQVLLNILSNAVKFTSPGGMVKIAATTTGAQNDNITITFSVRDNGIGMNPGQLAKICEPFTQAEAGITRKYGGTGLGLAISKNIIEMMGGMLSAESVLGIGSRFSFALTFPTVSPPQNDSGGAAAMDIAIEKPQFSGEVLICEDNPTNQQVLCDHLERIGLKSEIAGNGREGLDMVLKRVNEGRKPYDLIFMDIQMPVMDGIEAAFLIDKLRTGTPIVALTANIMAHDRELYLKNGMTECLGKPFLSQDLWRCLLKHLKPVNWKTESEAQSKMFDENLMGRLTVNFVNAHQGTYRAITAALDVGDIKQAHRLAHTLKGHAGLLGRTGLQKAAGQVESLIAGGRNLVTPEALSALETELNAALTELAGLLEQAGSPEAPPEAEPLGPEKARELLAELKPLLERGNPECLKLIDGLRGLSGSEKLIRQMEDLDFERAAETLREWDSEYFMSD